jgi:hypothetical protein
VNGRFFVKIHFLGNKNKGKTRFLGNNIITGEIFLLFGK